MTRRFLLVVLLGAVAVMVAPNMFSAIAQLFRDNEPAEAVFSTHTTISDWSEHRELATKLFAGKLDRSPNFSAVRRSADNPVPPTEEHNKGMVLRATSALDDAAPQFSFLVLYLARDPGMRPTKYVFENGRVSNKTMLIAGYVDLETKKITYGYPASGYIRIRPAGPNSIEVEYHVEYHCVSGDGTSNHWKADADCRQSLFPQSIVYDEAGAGVS